MKKERQEMKKTFLTLAVCMAGACLTASPLFEKGKSDWKVVIPVNATAQNKYAAGEFATAVKKISGVEIPVIEADTVAAGNHVVIGAVKTALIGKKAEALKLQNANPADDEIAVYTLDGNLYLAGSNPRSATFAVYHFLREYLGVRWLWPGADGEFMPAKESFTVPEIKFNYKAQIRYRSLTPCGNHGDYMVEQGVFRMFMNSGLINGKLYKKTGSVVTAGTHSVGIDSKDFDKHPDWFAVIGGKRRAKEGGSGCWSNPEFTKFIVERHVNMIKRSGAELLCAFPADTTMRCECPKCTVHPNRSARWYIYYAKLIEEIKKECPDIRAAGLAYQEFRAIPDIPVTGLEYVEYCLYNRCYIHGMNDPACSVNKNALDEIKRWQQKAPMGIYGYEFDIFNTGMYLPMHNQFAKSSRFFRDNKMVRVKTEYSARRPKKGAGRETADYICIRLPAYVFAMTVWNPDLDVNDIVKDFCKYVYAAGADAMYEYHTSMGKYWDAMDLHISYFGTTPNGCSINLLNPERIKAMSALLDKAEKAIAAMPDEKARIRAAADLAVDQFYFRKWVDTYEKTAGKAYILNLPKHPEGTDFDKLPQLPVTSHNNKHKPTDVRMYWSEKGLHFRVINREANLPELIRGEQGRDVHFWNHANVEFFLDLGDGMPFRQLGVNIAGGTYDAIGNDMGCWNPNWTATVKEDKANDTWSVEVFLPFTDFGGVVPTPGKTQWKINIIRNRAGGAECCGFPAAVYRDLDMGAYIKF